MISNAAIARRYSVRLCLVKVLTNKRATNTPKAMLKAIKGLQKQLKAKYSQYLVLFSAYKY